jgi:hypothetical protein
MRSEQLFMNPHTGTVQNLGDWRADYESDTEAKRLLLSFEEWAGELLEVVWCDFNKCWKEA